VTNSSEKRLKVLKTNGQWQRFSTENILDASEDNSFGRMLIDKKKWMATNRDVVGFNEVVIPSKKMTIGTDTGNLPASDVRALAIE
jgi:hypothetical protein